MYYIAWFQETQFLKCNIDFIGIHTASCRIWGEQGQEDLERVIIYSLKCGSTSSETLKNLVLGDIGSFTVVDGSKVEVAYLGNNFLGMSLGCSLQIRVFTQNISHFLHASYCYLLACAVDTESIGQSKAKCVCAFLQELNDAIGDKFVSCAQN